MAEGIFSRQVTEAGLEKDFLIDSAGTMAWSAGNPPDPFAQAAAIAQGIDISHVRARKLTRADLEYFDLVLVADESNYHEVLAISPEHIRPKIHYLMSYAGPEAAMVIPDPFGGGIQGFLQVFSMIENACSGLLKNLTRETG